jgi:hypothetical protein
MNKVLWSSFAAVLLVSASLAQTSAQASGSASQSTSVSANKSGAQAQSKTAAHAATASNVSGKSGKKSAAASNQLATGSTVHVTLAKPVDARKCKPGDPVYAKTTENVESNGKIVVPKGSKMVGHVTEARARTKGQSESALGIAFDHAVLKNGHSVPLTASIQAIAVSQQSATSAMGDDAMTAGEGMDGMASGGGAVVSRGPAVGGGLVGGAGSDVGATTGTLVNTSANVAGAAGGTLHGTASGLSPTGMLSSTSHGVVGLNGLSLASAASNSTEGSLITSSHQNVHLDSGTQMILLVNER